jgi:hypothetical protein
VPTGDEAGRIRDTLLSAYRWQYIVSGVEHPRFKTILSGMIDRPQAQRIQTALDTIVH